MAAFVSLLLGLLAFAGPAAITAVFSLGVAGQNVAYSIPIAARFFSKDTFVPGPFFLGNQVSYVDFVWGGLWEFLDRLGDDVLQAGLNASGDRMATERLMNAVAPWAKRADH